MKTTNANTELRNELTKLDADEYRVIRDAYYNAVCGLQTLADALERADTKYTESVIGTRLLNEHLIACRAIDAMKKSQLGQIL